jgi:hypothetical protein
LTVGLQRGARHAARAEPAPTRRDTSAACWRRNGPTAANPSTRAPTLHACRDVPATIARLRRSCHEIAGSTPRPVLRSQQTMVERCVASRRRTTWRPAPRATRARPPRRSAVTAAIPRRRVRHDPRPGVGLDGGTCAAATWRPSASKSTARLELPPWSSARYNPRGSPAGNNSRRIVAQLANADHAWRLHRVGYRTTTPSLQSGRPASNVRSLTRHTVRRVTGHRPRVAKITPS